MLHDTYSRNFKNVWYTIVPVGSILTFNSYFRVNCWGGKVLSIVR